MEFFTTINGIVIPSSEIINTINRIFLIKFEKFSIRAKKCQSAETFYSDAES